MSHPLLLSHLPFHTSTSSSSFTLPTTTPEHALQSGQYDLLQEHPVHLELHQDLPQSTSCAIKNHSGVKTAEWRKPAHDFRHRNGPTFVLQCTKLFGEYWVGEGGQLRLSHLTPATPSAGLGFGSDLATLGANPMREWCLERPGAHWVWEGLPHRPHDRRIMVFDSEVLFHCHRPLLPLQPQRAGPRWVQIPRRTQLHLIELAGVGGPLKTTSVSPCAGVGGHLKTTIVSPSPWNHCALCHRPAGVGGLLKTIVVSPWTGLVVDSKTTIISAVPRKPPSFLRVLCPTLCSTVDTCSSWTIWETFFSCRWTRILRSILVLLSQPTPTLQTTSASCIDWKVGPSADNFWSIWVGIPMMWTCTLFTWKLGRQMDVSVFTKMFSVPQHDDQNAQHDRDGRICIGKSWLSFHPDTGAHDDHVIAVREELNLHFFTSWCHWRGAVTLETSLVTVFFFATFGVARLTLQARELWRRQCRDGPSSALPLTCPNVHEIVFSTKKTKTKKKSKNQQPFPPPFSPLQKRKEKPIKSPLPPPLTPKKNRKKKIFLRINKKSPPWVTSRDGSKKWFFKWNVTRNHAVIEAQKQSDFEHLSTEKEKN